MKFMLWMPVAIILLPVVLFTIMKYGAYGWFKGKSLAERKFKRNQDEKKT